MSQRKEAELPVWPVSVALAAYPRFSAAARAGYPIAPAHPPLPTAYTSRSSRQRKPHFDSNIRICRWRKRHRDAAKRGRSPNGAFPRPSGGADPPARNDARLYRGIG